VGKHPGPPGRVFRDLRLLSLAFNLSIGGEARNVNGDYVSGQFFDTLGVPAALGRTFTPKDDYRGCAGGANPVGGRFRIRTGDTLGDAIEIVGVVKGAKYNDLRKEIPPTAYTAWSQTHFPFTSMEVRPAGGAPSALIGGVKGAIASVDASASIEFTTLADQVGNSLQRERLLATLAGFFGGLALLLDVIGLYGMTSYTVARRRNEIGIRMASWRGAMAGAADGDGRSGRLDWIRDRGGSGCHSGGDTPGCEFPVRSTAERSPDSVFGGGGAGRNGRSGRLTAHPETIPKPCKCPAVEVVPVRPRRFWP
jgi:hypothetical protein